MSLTRDDLAEEALANLFADGGTGQAPEAEDIEYVKARIDPLLEELSARSIVTIPDANDIEPKFFFALATLLANLCAPKVISQPGNGAVREDAEERLRIMVNNSPAASPTLGIDPLLQQPGYGLSLARWTRGY
jgi:hypothetical protein